MANIRNIVYRNLALNLACYSKEEKVKLINSNVNKCMAEIIYLSNLVLKNTFSVVTKLHKDHETTSIENEHGDIIFEITDKRNKREYQTLKNYFVRLRREGHTKYFYGKYNTLHICSKLRTIYNAPNTVGRSVVYG